MHSYRKTVERVSEIESIRELKSIEILQHEIANVTIKLKMI